MNLHPTACEPYDLKLTTVPTVTPDQWEASFDDSVTWHEPARVDGEWATWDVAGPDADTTDAPDAVVLPLGVTFPLVRCKEPPHVTVRNAAAIAVTR